MLLRVENDTVIKVIPRALPELSEEDRSSVIQPRSPPPPHARPAPVNGFTVDLEAYREVLRASQSVREQEHEGQNMSRLSGDLEVGRAGGIEEDTRIYAQPRRGATSHSRRRRIPTTAASGLSNPNPSFTGERGGNTDTIPPIPPRPSGTPAILAQSNYNRHRESTVLPRATTTTETVRRDSLPPDHHAVSSAIAEIRARYIAHFRPAETASTPIAIPKTPLTSLSQSDTQSLLLVTPATPPLIATTAADLRRDAINKANARFLDFVEAELICPICQCIM
jgi:hypothetical protein